ncbi:MAG: DUF4893 domain-containing protein [Myxococcota bacterium]|nr:DUF4893 domain-containing protein [Myxococcota bacterium]
MALFACWSGKADPSTTPGSASLEPSARDVSGPYWCSIDDAGYEYPRFPCVIKQVGGKLMLAKLAGSQRIRGLVTLDEREGFGFIGELYCPWGDCTEQMRGRFVPSGKGYKGTLNGPLGHSGDEGSMIVHLIPAPANAFGGNGYGGDGYGDPFTFGGASYGGASYGYYRIDRRGRRTR